MNDKIIDFEINARPQSNAAFVVPLTEKAKHFSAEEVCVSGDAVNDILNNLREHGLTFTFKVG